MTLPTSSIAPLLDVVTAWAASRSDIVGVAMVGSWARGTANLDSDIDLVLLTPNPEAFRVSSAWLWEIDWPKLSLSVQSYRDAKYGVVWSRHVEFNDGVRVEFSFGLPSWAATRPCDPGTQSVVSRGCRVLFDPAGLLQNVVSHVAQSVAQRGGPVRETGIGLSRQVPVIRPVATSPSSRGLLVVLNGASSSGKSTLAHLLQGALPGEFLHVQLDAFRAMEPPDYFRSTNPSRNKLRVAALCRSLHRATREFVDHGQNVLLDHVLSPDAWDYLLEDFADYSLLLISVLCSPEELDRREDTRGDRKAGLAASQAKSIHAGREYDFSIETSSATPAVCAAEIAAWLSLNPRPAAFMRMRARAPVA